MTVNKSKFKCSLQNSDKEAAHYGCRAGAPVVMVHEDGKKHFSVKLNIASSDDTGEMLHTVRHGGRVVNWKLAELKIIAIPCNSTQSHY
jgi:hypothetical protein